MHPSDDPSSGEEENPERIRSGEPDTRPVGQGDYLVRAHDCISSLAEANGFFWETIWYLPENRELRSARGDPNVLLAGDRVTIPALRPKTVDGATEKKHRFRRRGTPARLRISFYDDGDPRADEPYLIVVDGIVLQGTLDEHGTLDLRISPAARTAEIRIADDEPVAITLGSMDPIDSWSGLQLRLNNLGFIAGDVTGTPNGPTRAALRRFQHSQGLDPTGIADAETRDALARIHGV